jgi:hypothetical protein
VLRWLLVEYSKKYLPLCFMRSYKIVCFVLLFLLIVMSTSVLFKINFRSYTSDFYAALFFILLLSLVFLIIHILLMTLKSRNDKRGIYLLKYFNYAKYIWMFSVLCGICFVAFNPYINLFKGIGAGLFLIGSIFLFLDIFGFSKYKSSS